MIIKYFGAEWCGPCKVFKPVVEQVARERGCDFVYIDVQDAIDECRKNAVMGTPTVIFQNGDKEDRIVGIKPIEEVRAIVNSLL